MKVKRVLMISFFTVLMMAVFSSSAFCWIAQRVVIPYASINPATGYWTGLAIHNESDSSKTFNLKVYDSDGDLITSGLCWTIPAMGTKTDLLENYFTETVSGRMSLYIYTNGESDGFSVTMFMGNNGQNNPGFSFQTYYSEDFSQTVLTPCFIIPIIPPLL